MGHDHRHVPIASPARIPASGDAMVDAWIDALQDGDDAAARAVQRLLAKSADAHRLWPDATAAAQAPQGRHGHVLEASQYPSTLPFWTHAANLEPQAFVDPQPPRLPEPQHAMER